jgi:hypothetical protein
MRYFWMFSMTTLTLLLTACPVVEPPPCEGDDCPQLCEGVADAEVVYRPNSLRNTFSAVSEFDNCYTPGQNVNGTFSFQLTDESYDITQAVLRFDIVTETGVSVLRGNPIINTSSFKLTPDLTEPRTFFSKQTMLGGVSIAGSFRFASSAPAGDYRVVVSVVPTPSSNTVPEDDASPVVSFNYFFRIDR